MNRIDTRIAIGSLATNFGQISNSNPQIGKLPVKDVIAKSADTAKFDTVQTHVYFSTYGPHSIRTAIVVENHVTGEVIREIPSEEMQKLYTKMHEMLDKNSE